MDLVLQALFVLSIFEADKHVLLLLVAYESSS